MPGSSIEHSVCKEQHSELRIADQTLLDSHDGQCDEPGVRLTDSSRRTDRVARSCR